jgi:hypothetical protein
MLSANPEDITLEERVESSNTVLEEFKGSDILVGE